MHPLHSLLLLFLDVDNQFLASCIEKTIHLPLSCFAPLSKISSLYLYESLSGFYPVSLIYVSILLPILHCNYYRFTVNLENQCETSYSILYFKIILPILFTLPFHKNFETRWLRPTKNYAALLLRSH